MANGLINYGIVRPELATSFAQGFQDAETQALRQQAAKQQMQAQETTMQFNQEKLAQLRQEREQMLKLQQQLSQAGQNPDLDYVFDTMIKSGIPDYMTKGLEGKRRLDQQKQYARIMGIEMPGTAPATPNALTGAMPPPPAPGAEGGFTPMPAAPAPTAAPMAAPAAGAPRNALAGGGEVERLTRQINGLIALGTPEAIQAANVLERQLAAAQKPEKPPFMTVSKEGAIFDPATRQFLTPPRAAGGEVEAPKLKQGERWNAKAGRVEAVEGSDIYKKQKSAFAQDYKGAASVTDKMDEGIKKIDEILSPDNTGGFEGNFGGYNAYASRMLTGENTNMRKKIDSFKSTLKSAGLELMRQGGAIGQMTVQEWPIVEQMIDAISPELSENEAKRAFNEIRARFSRIKERAKDVYDTEYADSQFYKPLSSMTGAAPAAKGGAPAPAASMSVQDQQALQWANSNPNDPRAAQIKQRLGVR